MNRKLWDKVCFFENSFPHWLCPNCNVGILEMEKNKFFKEETITSKKERKKDYWEPDFIKYVFTTVFRCTNSKCKDLVIGVGNGSVSTYYDTVGHEKNLNEFSPLFFNPTLHLFEVPNDCDKLVREEIIKAFSLYWCDLASCANKIRIAIERLMDNRKVKKWEKRNSNSLKEKKIELHRRIELYGVKEPDIANHLLAIKWIGNAGTHAGTIKLNDVLTGFELLEYSLEKIYDNKEARMNLISKKINKKRGPIS
jgi:hypothetical protein